MGSFSVVDVGQATPNRFSCLLAPPEGSGGSLIQVVSTNEFISSGRTQPFMNLFYMSCIVPILFSVYYII